MKRLLLLSVLLLSQSNMSGHTGRTDVRSRFYYMEGTDLVIRAHDSSGHTARISIFRKGADPYDDSNTITIYPESWRSRIAVRPSSTDTLFVEPGIMVESSSDLAILPADKETIDTMEGALTYWYGTDTHTLFTGSIGMSYTYMIDQVPLYVITGAPTAEVGVWFIRLFFLGIMAFLAVAALIAYIFVRAREK